jgi:hypothetical protein
VSDARLLAVGTPGGAVSGFDGVAAGGGIVRRGGELFSLDAVRYRLWETLCAAPTVAALYDAVDGADHLLAELRDDRLVVAWPDAGLATRHTVRFVGRCLGNGDGGGDVFDVGDATGRPQVRVDLLIYEFLLCADGAYSIAEQCARIPGQAIDPVGHVVGALPTLMRAGLIQIDSIAAGG